jgi:NADH:ubiquinone oxidoreductase subunit E
MENQTDKTWTEEHQKKLGKIIGSFQDKRDPLIAVLQETQTTFGYLPRRAITEIANKLKIPAAHIFGVATFYTQFSFQPKGRHTILCCQGTACHVRGSAAVFDELKRHLDVEEGGTTEDGRFTLEKVYCVGCCSLAPAIIIDKTAYGKVALGKTREIIRKYA